MASSPQSQDISFPCTTHDPHGDLSNCKLDCEEPLSGDPNLEAGRTVKHGLSRHTSPLSALKGPTSQVDAIGVSPAPTLLVDADSEGILSRGGARDWSVTLVQGLASLALDENGEIDDKSSAQALRDQAESDQQHVREALSPWRGRMLGGPCMVARHLIKSNSSERAYCSSVRSLPAKGDASLPVEQSSGTNPKHEAIDRDRGDLPPSTTLVGGIQTMVVKAGFVNSSKETSIELYESGRQHEAYRVSISNAQRVPTVLIMRIPNHRGLRHQTTNNATVRKHLQLRLRGVPIPGISWTHADFPAVGRAYTVEREAPGRRLDACYSEFDFDQRMAIVDQVASILAEVWSLHFTAIGPLHARTRFIRDVRVGWYADSGRSTRGVGDELRSSPPATIREFIEQRLWQGTSISLDFVERFIAVTWRMPFESQYSSLNALGHPNLLPHNILVEMRDGMPKIAAVLDWDDAFVGPREFAFRLPQWLWLSPSFLANSCEASLDRRDLDVVEETEHRALTMLKLAEKGDNALRSRFLDRISGYHGDFLPTLVRGQDLRIKSLMQLLMHTRHVDPEQDHWQDKNLLQYLEWAEDKFPEESQPVPEYIEAEAGRSMP